VIMFAILGFVCSLSLLCAIIIIHHLHNILSYHQAGLARDDERSRRSARIAPRDGEDGEEVCDQHSSAGSAQGSCRFLFTRWCCFLVPGFCCKHASIVVDCSIAVQSSTIVERSCVCSIHCARSTLSVKTQTNGLTPRSALTYLLLCVRVKVIRI